MLVVRQILFVELVLAGGLGLIFAVMPVLASRALGLPRPEPQFWARLCGGLLAGIAAAIAIGEFGWAKQGLGLAGVVAINLAAVFVLLSVLVVGQPIMTRRGRAFLWLLTLVLFAIALFGAAWST
ncbi:MAG: hypothetical protein RL291_127 [Pseudomonadota bacterium]